MGVLSDLLIILVFVLFVFAVLVGINFRLHEFQCGQRWADSGMEYQYSWGGGCRVKTPAGVWIPAENFREI